MFFEAYDIYNYWSNLKIFRMWIKNASTTPSKSKQLQNVNNVRWESGNVTNWPREINDRKSEVIAFVVNEGKNVNAKTFIFKSKKEVSLSEVFALFNVVLMDIYWAPKETLQSSLLYYFIRWDYMTFLHLVQVVRYVFEYKC